MLDHPAVQFLVGPKSQIWMNGILFAAFIAQVPPTILWWKESIAYIAYLSVYAVIASHWAGLIAALSWLSAKRVEDGENGSPGS